MEVRIYHNPRCSKSRKTLALLKQRHIEPEIIDYLRAPPDKQQLEEIIRMLRISPRELIRRGEAEYKALGLDGEEVSDDDLVEAMLRHPVLIERPIVINGEHACIGRPPESVLEIL